MELDKVYEGNCMEIMKDFPKCSVDCVITDPPYGIDGSGFEIPEKSYKRIDAEWDKKEPNYLWIDEAVRLLKEGGAIYITGTHHNIFKVKNYLDTKEEMQFNNFLIWHKPNVMPIKFAKQLGIFAFSCEYILYYSKGKPKNFQYDKLKKQNKGIQQRDIFILKTCEDTKTGHPSQKPLKLMRKLITASSKQGDIILDPFAGSGTTLIASKQLGRRWVGIELNTEYISLINQRLKQTNLVHFSNTLLSQSANAESLIRAKPQSNPSDLTPETSSQSLRGV
jgi:DNA modification methylase